MQKNELYNFNFMKKNHFKIEEVRKNEEGVRRDEEGTRLNFRPYNYII